MSLGHSNAFTPAVLDGFVDAALAQRCSAFSFAGCALTHAAVPGLARLLRGSELASLEIDNDGVRLLDATAAALLADALRDCTTLRSLMLSHAGLWREPAAAVAWL
jgi:hypothetical protein